MWRKSEREDHLQYRKALLSAVQEDLLVGTKKDGSDVLYIELRWEDAFDFKHMNRYYFENNQPAGFEMGSVKRDSWPLDRSAISTRYQTHFAELADEAPGIKSGLEACLALLGKPGPNYNSLQECGF